MERGKADKASRPAGGIGRTDFSEDGVDLTLIRWMLSLTPAERLMVPQKSTRSLKR